MCLGTLFCALVTLGTSQKACVCDSFDMSLSFWTNFYFCTKAASQMFDWVLNTPQVQAIIMTFYLYQNIKNAARMTFYFAWEKLFFKKTLADSETELHFSCNTGESGIK